ncbi:hypothetical protein [Nonomuraea jabiensis]|uniref:hypothetical protein n=1 Tax=Nonomuraea jabiensis TaxID=882448 RepID=UPI003D7405A1
MADLNPNEHGWPFVSGPGQIVTQDHWQTMAKTWQSNGVVGVPEVGTPSAGNTGLTAVRASETAVTIQPGSATINGFYYDLKVLKDFSLDITGSDYTDDGTGRIIRRDLVVLKVDESLGAFRFVQIKNGVNNASGSWKVVLNDPATEIPLFQVDLEKEVGVDQIVDRRWFLSQSVRPLKFEQAGFEPVPRNGELGVDTTNSILVVGKDGQWVEARQVFTNDIPPEIASRLDTHDTQLTALDGRVSTVETELANLDVSGPQTHSYSITGPLAVGVGTFKLYNDTGKQWTIQAVRATVGTAPVGAAVTVDVNKNGTTIFGTQANRPTIASGQSTVKATGMTVTAVADGEYLTVDVDTIGTTEKGADLVVQIVVI